MSLNRNNGTLINFPIIFNAFPYISFNGINQYVITDKLFTNPYPFTLAVWFQTTVASGHKIMGFEDTPFSTNSNHFDRHLYVGLDGYLYFGVYSNGIPVTIRSIALVTSGKWIYIVVTSGSNGIAMFVNGVPVSQQTNVYPKDYNGYWRVTGYKLDGWINADSYGYFSGNISSVQVYSRALLSKEISQKFTALCSIYGVCS